MTELLQIYFWTSRTSKNQTIISFYVHLVWRRFPRNQHSTEGQGKFTSLSTQTEKAPSAILGLDSSAELAGTSRSSFAPDINYNSVRTWGDPLMQAKMPHFLILTGPWIIPSPRGTWRLGRGRPRIIPSPQRSWWFRRGHPSNFRQKDRPVHQEL